MPDSYKKITSHAILIFCLSSATGLIYNGLTPRGLPLLHHAVVFSENTELSLRQAYLVYRAGETVFIDSRSEAEYKNGHIRNAINIPFLATREEIMNFLRLLEQDQEIVVYCSNRRCESARRLAGFIKYIGYGKVYVFTDGFNIWHERGFPIDIQSPQ